MKTRLVLLVSVICLTTIAVSQQVSVNFNRSQSFSQFRTYAWGSNNANQVEDSILAQVAVQDIGSALQGKGWQKVLESENPSVIVTANGGLKQQTSYSAWGMRGIGGGMGGYSGTKCSRHLGRRFVRREEPKFGLAWNRTKYFEQQRQQESADGAESRHQDV